MVITPHPPTPTHHWNAAMLRSVLVRHVGINGRVCSWCDSATFVAAVARSLHASNDRFLRHPLGVLGQTQVAHGVYKGSGEIELAAKLARGVVEGERVMVVVEAFPWKAKRKTSVFCWMSTSAQTWLEWRYAWLQKHDNKHMVNSHPFEHMAAACDW